MTTEVHNQTEQASMGSLMSGILTDVQDLIKQQMQLTRKEIEADLRKTWEAASILTLGLGICFLGGFTFCLMLAHLLHACTIPAGAAWETAGLPLWGCYGIVTTVALVAGGCIVYAGKKKFDSFNPLPVESAQVLKENIEWIANKK